MTAEGKVLEQANKLFKESGILYERRQAVGGAYKVGSADFWCVIDGIHYEIEFKAIDGEKRSMQNKWALRCKGWGIECLCFKGSDEFRDWLNKKLGATK